MARRANQIVKYTTRRNFFIQKLGGKCVKCGAIEKLHFDHIEERSKLFPISWDEEINRLEYEVNKCQLLCASCHGKKSADRRWKNHKLEHGKRGTYTNHGCRCVDCKNINTKAARAYRLKKNILRQALTGLINQPTQKTRE